ncbi:MAG TPA: D-alanyl-D-alanine carboxypeptidase, partial [bacterium]|nr:D-alanyl-D-alanine carboxypeptidase [bacterium]
MRITKVTSAAVLAAVVMAFAAGAANAQARRSIEQILNDPVLKQSTVALLAKDLRTGQTLISINSDRMMIPASNMKLVTGAAAMLELGPAFKFHTDFMTKNFNPSTGLSDGIYVKGYGDPSISDRFYATAGEAMDAHAAQLKKNGFKGFSGVLWLDGSFMDNMRPASWPQEDLSWCYAPRPGALSAAGNCARVTVSAGASSAKAAIDPPVHPSFLRVSLKATTGNTSVKVSQDDKGVITVSGSVKKNTSAKYEHTVRKPTLLYGAALLGAMKRAGMKVSADMRETS